MRLPSKLAVAALLALALGCPKPDGESEADGGNEGDGGSGPRVVIYPHSTAYGETVPCTEGFCENGITGAMHLVWNDAGLNIKVEAAQGTIVNFAGEPIVVHKSPQDAVIPTLKAKLADQPIAQRFLRVDVHARSKMGPTAKTSASTVVLDLDFLRNQMMFIKDKAEKAEKADAGPPADAGRHGHEKGPGVLFEGESAQTKNGRHLIYLFSRGVAPPKLIGASAGARWRDIDYVAYETGSPSAGEKCAEPDAGVPPGLGIVGIGGHSVPYVHLLHSDIALYDRRTGKLVDHAAFDAKGKCPEGDDPSNDAAIEAWLKTKLAH